MAGAVVLITGANSGIGFHLARSLLEGGYRVAALDLSGENVARLAEAHPGGLRFYECDVSQEAQVNAAVGSVIREWVRIDILVNNACLAIFSPFEQKSPEDTRKEFEVNYFGYLHTIRAVLPYMKAQGKGIIHNVSSGVGITGFPGIYGYASTKGAIEALSRSLALELERYGIKVTLVHPPLTSTRSASGLGLPAEAMADPAEVGRKLARKIQRTRPVITPDLGTAVGLFLSRHFPRATGRLLAKLAQRAGTSGP